MELKPCPFCGSEAVILIDATRPSPYRDRLRVGCETAGCRGFYHAAWAYYETQEQAAEAWNTRAERTCRNASKVMDEHGQARFACSECGAWIDLRMLWNPEYRNGESPWVNDCKLNYCPNCGAKVVDE